MSEIYGIPYVGSKSRLCEQIVRFFPKGKKVYDLFGGGGAISFCALDKGYKVHYNELNTEVYNLVRKVMNRELDVDYYKKTRISREKFNELKDKDYVIKLCWSFGNNGTSYMYGKDIERRKYLIWCLDTKKPQNQEELDKLLEELTKERVFTKGVKTPYRIYYRWNYNEYIKHDNPRYWLKYRVKERIPLPVKTNNQSLQSLERLESLQSLGRLESLESLESLEITTSNKSYDEIEIEEGATIYCDPPYEGTEGGSGVYVGGFDHKKFKERCIEKSKTNRVIVSSYKFDVPGFVKIPTSKNSIMGTKVKNKEQRECVFIKQPK